MAIYFHYSGLKFLDFPSDDDGIVHSLCSYNFGINVGICVVSMMRTGLLTKLNILLSFFTPRMSHSVSVIGLQGAWYTPASMPSMSEDAAQ